MKGSAEKRLVPISEEQVKRIDALMAREGVVTNGLDRLALTSITVGFDQGLTVEEAGRIHRACDPRDFDPESMAYLYDALDKLRSFLDPAPPEEENNA